MLRLMRLNWAMSIRTPGWTNPAADTTGTVVVEPSVVVVVVEVVVEVVVGLGVVTRSSGCPVDDSIEWIATNVPAVSIWRIANATWVAPAAFRATTHDVTSISLYDVVAESTVNVPSDEPNAGCVSQVIVAPDHDVSVTPSTSNVAGAVAVNRESRRNTAEVTEPVTPDTSTFTNASRVKLGSAFAFTARSVAEPFVWVEYVPPRTNVSSITGKVDVTVDPNVVVVVVGFVVVVVGFTDVVVVVVGFVVVEVVDVVVVGFVVVVVGFAVVVVGFAVVVVGFAAAVVVGSVLLVT
jgi:hypothetical protein